MIRFAHPLGRLSVVQRASRFCPVSAGMTKRIPFIPLRSLRLCGFLTVRIAVVEGVIPAFPFRLFQPFDHLCHHQ